MSFQLVAAAILVSTGSFLFGCRASRPQRNGANIEELLLANMRWQGVDVKLDSKHAKLICDRSSNLIQVLSNTLANRRDRIRWSARLPDKTFHLIDGCHDWLMHVTPQKGQAAVVYLYSSSENEYFSVLEIR